MLTNSFKDTNTLPIESSVSVSSKQENYPYQNHSLKDLPGEIWRDMHGYEDYQISNKGRVKVLRRWIAVRQSKHGGYWQPERIVAQYASVKYNQKLQQQVYTLQFATVIEGKNRKHSTARMVYYTFVESFDLNDRYGTIVSFSDHDSRNCQPENLYLTTHSHKQIQMVRQKRKRVDTMPAKVVSQYDLSGNRVAVFESLEQACTATGILRKRIKRVAEQLHVPVEGYFWRYDHQDIDKIDVSLYKEKQAYMRILQLTLQGQFVASYESISSAAKAVGGGRTNIYMVLHNHLPAYRKCKTAKGYVWVFAHAKDKLDWKSIQNQIKSSKPKVLQLTQEGKIVACFDSIAIAAKATGATANAIGCVIHKRPKYKTAGGFVWKYEDIHAVDNTQ